MKIVFDVGDITKALAQYAVDHTPGAKNGDRYHTSVVVRVNKTTLEITAEVDLKKKENGE